MFKAILLVLLLSITIPVWARGTYQTPADFLAETFKQQVPKAAVIWLSGEIRKTATEILTHKPKGLRVRYWANTEKSAWVLEEIGKEQPITVGFVISQNKIKQVKVLVFRESRGSEVRHDFFTRQFTNARLIQNKNQHNKLDRYIDGITGATLSVRALTRLSRLALYLDQQRLKTNDSP
ncbi:FMN-binding protein [Beggiatoa alba]|nr:FMN-binding protein [Beggiatoa alba]